MGEAAGRPINREMAGAITTSRRKERSQKPCEAKRSRRHRPSANTLFRHPAASARGRGLLQPNAGNYRDEGREVVGVSYFVRMLGDLVTRRSVQRFSFTR